MACINNADFNNQKLLYSICSPFTVNLHSSKLSTHRSIIKANTVKKGITDMLENDTEYVIELVSELTHLGRKKKERAIQEYSGTLHSLRELIVYLARHHKNNFQYDTQVVLEKLVMIYSIKCKPALSNDLYSEDLKISVPCLYRIYMANDEYFHEFKIINNNRSKNLHSIGFLIEKEIIVSACEIIDNSVLSFEPCHDCSLSLCNVAGDDCGETLYSRIQHENSCFYKILSDKKWIGYFTILDITLADGSKALLFDIFNVNPQCRIYSHEVFSSVIDNLESFLQGYEYRYILIPDTARLLSNHESIWIEIYQDRFECIDNKPDNINSYSEFQSVMLSWRFFIARDLHEYGQLTMFD